jgi:hypothetical protein
LDHQFTHVTEALQQSNRAHVFYCFNEMERYIDNAVSYIVSGIEQGEHVLFVENERIYPRILTKLEQLLTKEQLTNLHFICNFTFYWRNGNFHPETILSFFSDYLKPYIASELAIRTWGHIEWSDEEDIARDLEEFEQAVDNMMTAVNAAAVCAYDAHRLTEPLKTRLLDCHTFLMTDDKISPITK